MFRRQDPEFPARARSWGGGLIVAGHNYGQGSSREVAAIAPIDLGIPAVVAKSFARIHRRNLICQGILPLEFADEADLDGVAVGDTWRIDGAREAVERGVEEVAARAGDRPVVLRLTLSPSEREMLLAGGLLALLRSRAAAAAH